MELLEVQFSTRWKSLGSAVHYYFHCDFRGREVPLPDPRSKSVITLSGGRGDESYPPENLVRALDRRAGVSDEDLWAAERLAPSLAALRDYDCVMSRLVTALCINGRVTLLPGSKIRHYSHEDIVDEPPWEGDVRKLNDWMHLAWDMLSVLLATPSQIRAALEANAVSRQAAEWAMERGLLNGH